MSGRSGFHEHLDHGSPLLCPVLQCSAAGVVEAAQLGEVELDGLVVRERFEGSEHAGQAEEGGRALEGDEEPAVGVALLGSAAVFFAALLVGMPWFSPDTGTGAPLRGPSYGSLRHFVALATPRVDVACPRYARQARTLTAAASQTGVQSRMVPVASRTPSG